MDTKKVPNKKNIKDQAIDANKIIENLEKENKELKDFNNNFKNELQIKQITLKKTIKQIIQKQKIKI